MSGHVLANKCSTLHLQPYDGHSRHSAWLSRLTGRFDHIYTMRRITKTPAHRDPYRTPMHPKGTPQCLSVGLSAPRLIQGQSTNLNVLLQVYLQLFISIFPLVLRSAYSPLD